MKQSFVLSLPSVLRAAQRGYARTENAFKRHMTPRHRNGSLWGGSIESACAELVISQWTILPWTGEFALGLPPYPVDVGDDLEVRWVAPPTRYEATLNLDPAKDHHEYRYALVTGFCPNYEILGVLTDFERGLQPGWRTTYPERVVYRVPASALDYLAPG